MRIYNLENNYCRYKVAFFIKTCIRDIQCFEQLIKSINEFNADNIPICVSVATSEYQIIKSIIDKYNVNYLLIKDEELAPIEELQFEQSLKPWVYQQIVKLNMYKLDYAEHFIVIDSDCYFIQKFYISDFLLNNKLPFLPITSHTKGERILMSILYRESKKYSEFKLREPDVIQKFLNRVGQPLTLDMPFVLTVDYLKYFLSYITEKGYSIEDILNICPNEMQWYLEFVLLKDLPFALASAFFMPFHLNTQYQIFKYLGFTEKDFIPNYLGILMNKGHVNEITFKSSILGKIIRAIIRQNYRLTRGRYDK